MDELYTAPAPRPSIDPFAPPDARWRTAEKIADGRDHADEYTDAHVMAALRHLKARSVPNSPGFDGSIAIAAGIYRDDILLRIEVEGRIIAGQADHEIAKSIGTSEVVVRYYRSLFFDVYGGATDYLAKHVTGFRAFQPFRKHEVREFILSETIRGGLLILELWLQSMRAAHRPGEKTQLSDYLQPDRELPPTIQRLVAVACVPQDGPWAEWWNQLEARWDELKADPNPPSRAIQEIRLQKGVIRAAQAVLSGVTSPPIVARQDKRAQARSRQCVRADLERKRPQGVKELQTQLQELLRSF